MHILLMRFIDLWSVFLWTGWKEWQWIRLPEAGKCYFSHKLEKERNNSFNYHNALDCYSIAVRFVMHFLMYLQKREYVFILIGVLGTGAYIAFGVFNKSPTALGLRTSGAFMVETQQGTDVYSNKTACSKLYCLIHVHVDTFLPITSYNHATITSMLILK